MDITTIGFDLAKTVFQVHGADGEGRVVLWRKLRRGKVLAFFAGLPSCLVGMEACASAHYWARELQALGHKVRLIPPQYVRPFVKTNKNDAADAEAICEAVTRPTMRFAPAKSAEQQSVLMLHRARELLVCQRTMVINALRGHCAELGLIVAQGASRVEELVAIIEDPGDERLPPLAREALGSLVEQFYSAQARIKQLEATLMAWHRSNQASRRLATIPGVGVITATALVATIGDGAQFRSGRQLSAWLGLVPRQHSSGGKDIFVSAITFYEIENKIRLRKLDLKPQEIRAAFSASGMQSLAITDLYAELAATLDWEHRDPWDRLLAAQARLEQCALVSIDKVFDDIAVERLW